MNLKIGRGHLWGGIFFLLIYDLVKYGVFGDLFLDRGIDPEIFLFLDMATVPLFIMGSARLVNSLTGAALAWPKVLCWGIVVIINTVLPYVYAAAAGKAHFDATAWAVFWGLVILILANLFRTLKVQVREKKNRPCKPAVRF